MKNTVKFLGLLFFIAACKTETEQRIVGKWQATQLMECDNMIPIQTELVDIEFTSNGNYVFHSTLNVKEEGTYRLKKNYLFTQDKLREKAPEKAVLIKSIDQDSLVLQMSYKGKDQYLFLVKDGVKEKNKAKEDAASKTEDLVASTAATATVATAAAMLTSNPMNSDSIKQVEAAKSAKAEGEKKKQAEADKAAERKKEEAVADKKREAEADRKREEAKKKSKKGDNGSSSEAYKKREAKRKEAEKDAKREAEKKAEKFRKEYAKREAEKKKKKK